MSDGGDPFILGLLVEEWAEHGPIEGLSARGLEGLWHRQSGRIGDALREGGGPWAVLSALAAAVGPLARDDLLELVAETIPTGVVLDEAMTIIGRFVLRPAPRTYVFCHTRLRQYVEEDLLSPAQRDDWQRHIATWAVSRVEKAALNGAVSIPGYVVRHLVHHLERVSALDGLDPWLGAWSLLLESTWFEAREIEGGAPGYCRDVEALRAILAADDGARLARGARPVHIGRLIRCALHLCSVKQASRISVDVLTAAVQEEVVSPARALAIIRHRAGRPETGPLLDEDWAAFVATLPGDLLPEALDIASGGEHGLLAVLVDRSRDWFPLVGDGVLAWLATDRRNIRLLARLHRQLDDPLLQTKVEAVIVRLCQSAEPRTRLWWCLADLQGVVAGELLRVWALEIMDIYATEGDPSRRRSGGLPLLDLLHASERVDRVRAAMTDVAGEEPDACVQLLEDVVRHAPDLTEVAIGVLRKHERLDALAPFLWPDVQRIRTVFYITGGDPRDGEGERWARVRDALTDEENDRLLHIAADRALAPPVDLGDIRALAPYLETHDLVDLLERVDDADRQRNTRRWVLAHLPRAMHMECVSETAEHGSRWAFHQALQAIDATEHLAPLVALGRETSDPWKRCMALIYAADATPPGVDRQRVCADAWGALGDGIQGGVISGEESLRLGALLIVVSPDEQAIETVLETAEYASTPELAAAWERLQELAEALPPAIGGPFLERIVDVACRCEPFPMNLSPPPGSRLPARLERRAAKAHVDRAALRGGHAAAVAMIDADDGRPRVDRVRAAMAAARRIGDEYSRIKLIAAVSKRFDRIERRVRGALEASALRARMDVWRILPEPWFEHYRDLADQAARDEWAYTTATGAMPQGWIPQPNLILQRGGEAIYAEYGADIVERLGQMDAALVLPIESYREMTPDEWEHLHHSTGDRRWYAVQSLVGVLSRALPLIDTDAVRTWLPRVPLYPANLTASLIGCLPEDERRPWVDEVWRYASTLTGVSRGTQMSVALGALDHDQRYAAVDEVLDEIGDFRTGPNSSASNRPPILLNVASWLDHPHLSRIVDEADKLWSNSASNLGPFLARLAPGFRSRFVAAFSVRVMQGSAARVRAIVPTLVACDNGLLPSVVDDWRVIAGGSQSEWTIARLTERLPLNDLKAYVLGWLNLPGGNRTEHLIGRLVTALIDRAHDEPRIVGTLYPLVVELLFRKVDTRGAVLTRLADINEMLGALAGVPLGECIADAVQEVGHRWP